MSMALDGLEEEIQSINESVVQEKRAVMKQKLEDDNKAIRENANPLAGLPSQGPSSLAFHTAIVEAVQKKSQPKINKKKAFLAAKAKRASKRAKKRGGDYADKLSARASKLRRKAKGKNKSKSAW